MPPKDLVKALRVRLGLTQEQFAEAADLEREEIVKIETGKNKASTVHIQRGLAKATGSTLEDMADYMTYALGADEFWRRVEARRASRGATSGAAGAPFPNRTEAADIARRGGISADAIAAVVADTPATPERSTLEWIELMRLRELQIRRAESSAPPPSPKRRKL